VSDPWFRFFPSDWLSGVSGLSAAERGVYITILAIIYDNGGAVARDDVRLSRQCGLPKSGFSRAIDGLLLTGKLTMEDGCLFNARAKIELTERENRKLNAIEAAKSRWEKDKENQQKDNGSASPSQCGTNATRAPIPQPHSSNEEISSLRSDMKPPLVENPISSRGKRKMAEFDVLTILGQVVCSETAAELVEHRKSLKSPMTAGAAKGLVKSFAEFGDPERAARAMMANGWKGFEASWMKARAGPGNSRTVGRSALEVFKDEMANAQSRNPPVVHKAPERQTRPEHPDDALFRRPDPESTASGRGGEVLDFEPSRAVAGATWRS
jgi:uncharacterized protein YdaU (DUF1376 family)